MKTSILNIRINERIKEELELIGLTRNQSVSELVRESLNTFIENSNECGKEHKYSNDQDSDILQSLGFAELIFFVCYKNFNPEICEIDELYIQFINLIKEMEGHPLFTPEIIKEFKKVSIELEMVLYHNKWKDGSFDFPFEGENAFNYEVLANFMHTVRYDEDNITKIIHIK